MALPSFQSPPFHPDNYAHFGADVDMLLNLGLTCNKGYYTDANGHSMVSHPFLVYNSRLVSNVSRQGGIPDVVTGPMTNYFEFQYSQSDNYTTPEDFIRLKVTTTKEFVGPVGVGNPLKIDVSVITQQLGIVYTYPTYNMYNINIPNAAAIIEVGPRENGHADVTVEWNDVVNGEAFSHVINNYSFDPIKAGDWQYHTLLNLEANPDITPNEDYQSLQVQAGFITPTGIESEEALGDLLIETAQNQIINVPGIVTGEALGFPQLSSDNAYIVVPGIPSGEYVGVHRVTRTTTVQSALREAPPTINGDMRGILDAPTGHIEIQMADRDVERDEGLSTDINITLSSDRRALPDDVLPDDSGYKGGWCMDTTWENEGDLIGTRLWLLKNSKATSDVPQKAKEYMTEGFQYLLDDGVASNLIIQTWIDANKTNTLIIVMGVVRPDTETLFFKFYYNWEYQIARRFE